MNEGSTYPFHFHPFLIQGKVKVVGNLFSHPNFQYPQFQSPLIPHPHFTSPKIPVRIHSSYNRQINGWDQIITPSCSFLIQKKIVNPWLIITFCPVPCWSKTYHGFFLKRIRIQWPIVTQLQARLVQSANQARVSY
jgi:hypothetical protein